MKQTYIKKLIVIAWNRAGWRLPVLILVAFLASIAEMFGIAMVLPLFNVASNGKLGNDFFSQFISQGLEVLGLESTLQVMLVVIVIAFLLKAGLVLLTSFIELWTTTMIRRNIQINLASLIENASFGYHSAERVGNNTNLLSRESERFTSTIRNLAQGTVAAVSSFVFIMTIGLVNPFLTLLIALLCLFVMVGLKPLILWTRNYSILTTKLNAAVQNSLIELVHNFAYLKATHGTEKLHINIVTRINELTHIQRRLGFISDGLSAIKEPIGILSLAGIIYYDVVQHGKPIGEVIVIGMFLYRIVHKVLDIQNNWQRINNSIGGALAVEDGIQRLEAEQEITTGKSAADFGGKLVLTDVSVNYGDKRILSGINLSIRPYETIGIVGPSGAGKSTLFHLITGLLKPLSGTICLGNVNYDEIDKKLLRSQIGYVTQDPAMFHATLAENIAFWTCEPKDKDCLHDVEIAAQHAGCTDLLDRAHELVGEYGKQLSGGQKQRVAIARELFKDPPLLIFDEATSALDSQSEVKIQQSINALHGERTILIIAHRMSTVRGCDRIIVLNEGSIIQQGSFNNLWEDKKGLFHLLCERQGVSS
tara:strand:+ start:14197 stop:15972 length:1776 start_codon:yes stop_codon:yes gene_type:complete